MKRIDSKVISDTSRRARKSIRRRMNFNFHQHEEPLQRLVNAVEPESYIRPHCHREPGKVEVFVVLKGKGAGFEFDDQGNTKEVHILEEGGEVLGVIFDPGTWHTILALVPGTAFFEVKIGPYQPLSDEAFAPWAPPPEDTDGVRSFQKRLWEELGFSFPLFEEGAGRKSRKLPG